MVELVFNRCGFVEHIHLT